MIKQVQKICPFYSNIKNFTLEPSLLIKSLIKLNKKLIESRREDIELDERKWRE